MCYGPQARHSAAYSVAWLVRTLGRPAGLLGPPLGGCRGAARAPSEREATAVGATVEEALGQPWGGTGRAQVGRTLVGVRGFAHPVLTYNGEVVRGSRLTGGSIQGTTSRPARLLLLLFQLKQHTTEAMLTRTQTDKQ